MVETVYQLPLRGDEELGDGLPEHQPRLPLLASGEWLCRPLQLQEVLWPVELG